MSNKMKNFVIGTKKICIERTTATSATAATATTTTAAAAAATRGSRVCYQFVVTAFFIVRFKIFCLSLLLMNTTLARCQ